MDAENRRGRNQAAGHGFGDVEVAQKTDLVDQVFADQQHQGCADEGVVSTEIQLHAASEGETNEKRG
ncbi:hypothetical protein D3C71_1627320 [compost metagenome]